MGKTVYQVKDNARYGLFGDGSMVFHGTMSDCIMIAENCATEKEDKAYRIGLVEIDECGSVVLGTPVMTYVRKDSTIYVINELI